MKLCTCTDVDFLQLHKYLRYPSCYSVWGKQFKTLASLIPWQSPARFSWPHIFSEPPGEVLLRAVQRSCMQSRNQSRRRPGNEARPWPHLHGGGSRTKHGNMNQTWEHEPHLLIVPPTSIFANCKLSRTREGRPGDEVITCTFQPTSEQD